MSRLLLLLFLLGCAAPIRAQVPELQAHRRTEAISVDGRLDEADWRLAPYATDFVQQSPVEGDPALEPTRVHVVYDEHAIYLGARMFDSDPSSIARQMVRRDDRGQYDVIKVLFDPNMDQRTGYVFAVSAANVQSDMYMYNDGEGDETWDAVWASAVRIDSAGWTAEMRIPLSQMRYEARAGVQTWGFNVARERISVNEETHFSLISQLQEGIVSQSARLEGIQIETAARRLELRPYVLASTFRGPSEAGNPYRDGTDHDGRVGLDVRYGIGGQFTLDATINPDFGQVEADPAEINLTAFETFFRERRPFFVEDARVFDFTLSGHGSLLYPRRIGRRPHGRAPDDADYSDVPNSATILGAAKLTGRTAGGLSVGVLTALTDREHGKAYDAATGTTTRFLAEPATGYGVVRIRQDLNGGASSVGGIVTMLRRDLPDDGGFDALPGVAWSGGLDWQHQWNDRTWSFHGYVAGSHVRGDSLAMIRLQRSSNHYFQRPDSRWLSFDSSRTSLTGLDWRMTFEKQRGDHWTWSVWAAEVTSGFEVNDLGFSRRQEVLDGGARLSYREITPGSVLRSYAVSLFTFHNWSHDALKDVFSRAAWGRAHSRGSVSLRSDITLLNYWELEGSFSFSPEKMNYSGTRGGPLVLDPRSYSTRIEVQSDRRTKFNAGPSLNYEWAESGSGHELSLGVDMEYRPSSRVEIEVEPEWSKSRTGGQYVYTSSALSYAPTFGSRYLFGELDRTELALQMRVNVTFTPHLSLQVFAQPLISSGDYAVYKQLRTPETFDFDTLLPGTYAAGACVGGRTCVDGDGTRYVDFDGDGTADDSFGDRSFNVRSLIGNAVLRWEYRPGSTLFLVWQRHQESEVQRGDFDFRRDVDALLSAESENVFMIKLNYWFGL